MNNLIELILSNPIYQVVVAVIIISLFFFIVKKLFKLVLISIVVFIAFLFYVHYSGGDVSKTVKQVKDKSVELIDSAEEGLK